jgi:hypothetical protein
MLILWQWKLHINSINSLESNAIPSEILIKYSFGSQHSASPFKLIIFISKILKIGCASG